MDKLDHTLEERLARLEAGEPLKECLADLPEEEAVLLKKAAALRQVANTVSVSNEFTDQRQKLLRLATENNKMSSKTSSPKNKFRLRWVFPVVLAGGAFTLLTCVVILSLLAGSSGAGWLHQQQLKLPHGVNSLSLEASSPHSAVLKFSRGLVEIQDNHGAWQMAWDGQTVKAGQRIRTGALSSVTVSFYDGSQTQIGPNSELSVDKLDAQKSGPRVISLTQWRGESKHDVAKSSDPDSHYEVHTPSGVGTAKGTSFRVFVLAATLVRFDVDEGAVAVTNLNTTVMVVAGQTTVIVFGQVPTPPVFRISGEGIVEQTGSIWHIAGRTFRTDANTVLVGDPQVGDEVAFQARIVADGSPILDSVMLLAQNPDSRFSFSGNVETMGNAEWTVSGRTVQVDDKTDIDQGIQAGDLVEVKGHILENGEMLATDIHLLAENDEGLPFEFVGVIDGIGSSEWTIAGITITVDDHTQIEAGLVAGDIARVQGRTLDGTWLAKSIERAEENDLEFTITGSVGSIDPWMVAGVSLDTDENTRVDDGIVVGSQVRAEGHILADGSWVAEEIELIRDPEPSRFDFTGLVNSIDPWNVGGIDFTTDEHTVVAGQIAPGDRAHVSGVTLPDGTLLAEQIQLVENDLGCLNFSTAVREVNTDQIVLLDWHVIKRGHGIKVEGDLHVATVILITGCTNEDGSFSITEVIVIYQLESLPVITHPSHNGGGEGDEDEHDDGD